MSYYQRILGIGMLCLLIAPAATAQRPLQEIKPTIIKRVHDGPLVGISVGYINSQGKTSYFSKGLLSASCNTPVDQHSIFEIGSVTKLFTSLALARLIQEQEISLADKAESLLPEKFELPDYKGSQITIQHLLTHTSGLPKIPSNLNINNPARPYTGYSASRLINFLAEYELSRAPGTKFAYSNIGMALAGYILEEQTDLTYEQVVNRQVLDPLQMTNSGIKISAEENNRLAIGHRWGREVPGWDLSVFEGAGALHSTTADMIAFLKAQMGVTSELRQPILMMQEPLFDTDKQAGQMHDKVGMGWLFSTKADTILWHNGATGGYRSFIGYNLEHDTGVVLLSNSSNNISELGFHLLDQEGYPLENDIELSEKELEKFVGEYQAAPGAVFDVTRKDKQLYVQLSGQNKFPIYPKSETRFYLKTVAAEIEFKMSKDRATQLILYQNGREVPAGRMENH